MPSGHDLITGELEVGGRARSFTMRLPAGATEGIPLVLVLHGNHPDARGQLMRDWTTFDEQADTWGFTVAYPDGHGGCWADGRGVTTADEAGISNGAFMGHRLGLEASDQVAVLAAVAGGLPASRCPAGRRRIYRRWPPSAPASRLTAAVVISSSTRLVWWLTRSTESACTRPARRSRSGT